MRRAAILLGIGATILAAAAAMSASRRWAPGSQAHHQAGETLPAATSGATSRRAVALDSTRQQQVGVRRARVQRGVLQRTLRTSGQVRFDETRLTDINLKVEGWIRDLYVASTGESIGVGQRLLSAYSPELLKLQTEYLQAVRTRETIRDTAPDALPRADELVQSARRELELRDISAADILALDNARHQLGDVAFLSPAAGMMTLMSPAAGVIVDRHAIKGMHVMAGDSLYTIVDLSRVWIEAAVKETDISLVSLSSNARIALDAYPGEHLTGRVVLLSPYIDEKTRTNKVRIDVDNHAGRVKPGMYADVEFTTNAGDGLTGPRDAVIDSGAEQMVFVAEGSDTFQPRRVTVGRRLGDAVEILAGLAEGDEVATGATFFLDAESQLRGVASSAVPSGRTVITLRTLPNPPVVADTQFEVRVQGIQGPIDNAKVMVELFMPAMPAMNMPPMKAAVSLTSTGQGVYRGRDRFPMSGDWQATVVVESRDGELARQHFPLSVR